MYFPLDILYNFVYNMHPSLFTNFNFPKMYKNPQSVCQSSLKNSVSHYRFLPFSTSLLIIFPPFPSNTTVYLFELGTCEPIPPILLFAGEATIPGHYSTVHGARLSGIREAERIIQLTKRFGGPPKKEPVKS